MNHLFSYIAAREHQFAGWLANLIDFHKKTGTLPTIPPSPLTSEDIAAATLPNVGTPVVTPTPAPAATETADHTAGPESPSLTVALQLPAGSHWANVAGAPHCLVHIDAGPPNEAYAIDEIKNLFAEGTQERAFLQANLDLAHGMQVVENDLAFFPACRTLPPHGTMNDLGENIAGTQTLPALDRNGNPKLPTVASALAWFAPK